MCESKRAEQLGSSRYHPYLPSEFLVISTCFYLIPWNPKFYLWLFQIWKLCCFRTTCFHLYCCLYLVWFSTTLRTSIFQSPIYSPLLGNIPSCPSPFFLFYTLNILPLFYSSHLIAMEGKRLSPLLGCELIHDMGHILSWYPGMYWEINKCQLD